MAVGLSSISGRVYPAWQSVFSSISAYPAWQWAYQASLEESILHGSQLLKHLCKSLSCRAVSFSSISGRVYPEWQSEFCKHLWKSLSYMAVSSFKHLWQEPILHGSQIYTSISGRAYPGSQLFKHGWKSLCYMAARFYKHLWKSLSCMAVSFSSISGRVYPAWQSASQASLEESILHGSELFKHLWKSLS